MRNAFSLEGLVYKRRKRGRRWRGRRYLRAPLVNWPTRPILILLSRAGGVLLYVYVAPPSSVHLSFVALLMRFVLPAHRLLPWFPLLPWHSHHRHPVLPPFPYLCLWPTKTTRSIRVFDQDGQAPRSHCRQHSSSLQA